MFQTLLVTPDACYPDGTWTQLKPLPEAYELDGWGTVLDRAQSALGHEGVLLLAGGEAARLGLGAANAAELNDQEQAEHPAALDARGHGWKVTAISAWTTYQRPAEPGERPYALHVGVLDWMSTKDVPTGSLDDPISAASVIHAWQLEFGCPWAGRASVAGVTLLRHVARGPHSPRTGRYERPRWQLPQECAHEAWHSAAAFRGMSWKAPDVPAHRYEHVFDVNRQWLNTASFTPLCSGVLTHTGRMPYDAKRSGFWLVEFEPWTRGHLLPDPAGHQVARAQGKPVWVTTPRLGLVDQLAKRSDEWQHPGYRVLDSWTGPGSLVLKPWAEALRFGVLEDVDLGPAAKDVYATTLTSISRPGRWVYRPDWACSVVDMAHANLWRKLVAVHLAGGPRLIRIDADQPTYASEHADWHDELPALLALDLNETKPGKLKHKKTMEVANG